MSAMPDACTVSLMSESYYCEELGWWLLRLHRSGSSTFDQVLIRHFILSGRIVCMQRHPNPMLGARM
jgi:hypothetical protein